MEQLLKHRRALLWALGGVALFALALLAFLLLRGDAPELDQARLVMAQI